MFGIGAGEFIIILIVGLIVFGPSKLPEVGRAIGKGLREFRKAQAALSQTLNEVDEPPKSSPPVDKPPVKPLTTESFIGDKPATVAQPTTQPVTADTSQVTVDTPQVTVDKPQVTVDKPQVTVDKPSQVTVDKPQVTVDKSQVTVDKPATVAQPTTQPATADTSQVTVDKPQVTVDKPPQVTVDKSQVTADTSQVTVDKPQVTADTSQVTVDKPQVTVDDVIKFAKERPLVKENQHEKISDGNPVDAANDAARSSSAGA